MTPRYHRNGSALLIVLGMLAFMIVSAVGFAAYMRYARLPSSYLRKTASSRQLVKAAVAEAIDTLDRAVNNNPHPGIGSKYVMSDNRNKNIWRGRVLMGTNEVQDTFRDFTVPVLSLEALAYIPPPLVNAVRYYSRLTPSAQWQSFDFDAGRYAFCIVDVSDYFDINRLMADSARSSAPNERISLSYIFEEGREHRGSGSGATEWDNFMKKFRDVDDETGELDFSSRYPLVSVADFNLAVGQNGAVGGIKSPFYDYVSGKGGSTFLSTGSEEDEDKIRRLTFVTDSLFPRTTHRTDSENSTEIYDLNDSQHQPFSMETLKRNLTITETVMGDSLNDSDRWLKTLSGIGCGALADYLDENFEPVSLAIPTTERVPMICGIRPMVPGSKFSIEREMTPPDDNVAVPEGTRQATGTVVYKIKSGEFVQGFMGGRIEALAAYPFLRGDDDSSRRFTIDGQFSMFFTTDVPTLRLPTASFDVSMPKSSPEAEWNKDTGFINIGLTQGNVMVKDNILKPQDAVVRISEGLQLSKGTALGPQLAMSGNELLSVTYKWTQTKHEDESGNQYWTPKFAEVIANPQNYESLTVETKSNFKILNPANRYQPYDITGMGAQIKASGNDVGVKDVRLNAAVWLRIKEADRVVDMVPASLLDDATQNNKLDAKMVFEGLQSKLGRKNPILPLETGVKFDFTINALNNLAEDPAKAIEIQLSPETILVSDPRYNYAPEAWYRAENGGALSEETWLQNNGLSQGGGSVKSRDIFMATSDASYLQSIYELAFIPRFTTLENYTDLSSGNLSCPNGDSRQGIAANFSDTWCHNLAWTTFDPIDADREAFEKLPWVSEGTGYKVNPYSDSTNVLMAAYANTPLDWRRASTNANENASQDHTELKAAEFNSKYAYNEYSSGGRFKWYDLQAFAGAHLAAVRSNDNAEWYDSWNGLWRGREGEDERTLCGIELEEDEKTKVYGVDKKFLYGYWRECFAAKQQLYLVFVRAEPMMMGSGSANQLPPQLGGKAMALVWRDPTKTKKDDGTPHKTRVLFYRQFE